MSKLIPFDEIKKYPLHYLSEIQYHDNDKYILYQYGPYLIMNTKSIIKKPDIKDKPIMRLLMDIGELIKISKSNLPYMKVKSSIIEVIKDLNTYPYKYSDIVRKNGFDLLNKIKMVQRKNNSLESALLNYSPIVPYTSTIVRPDVSNTIPDITYDELGDLIENVLINNVMHIMYNNEDIINTPNEALLPEDLLKKISSCTTPSSFYFTLVYLKYCVDNESSYKSMIDDIEKINMHYNKIIKGDEIIVTEAIESFEKISITDIYN